MKSGRLFLPVICAALFMLTASVVWGQTASDSTGGQVVPFFERPINSETYLIRPGEQLRVVFINSQLPPLALEVNAESRIVHQKLGIFDLSGRTLDETRDLLREPLSELYNADQINISIQRVYPVSIRVTGNVRSPGRYIGYTSQRVSDVIDSAGGISPGGSRRSIQFKSEGRILPVDLDRAEFHGDYDLDPNLYTGNRIHVPAATGAKVYIMGEVNEPRSVELLPDDDLELLVSLAGGLRPDGDIESAYILGDTTRAIRADGGIRGGDFIMIPRLPGTSENNDFTVLGAVKKPGRIEWNSQTSLDNLLSAAGGLAERANPHRIVIFRQVRHDVLDIRQAERFPLAVGSLEADSKLLLEPSDSIVVASLVGYVRVTGAVVNPGIFPFVPGQDAGHYLTLAGGIVRGSGEEDILFRETISGLERSVDRGDPVYDGLEIIVRKQEPEQ